MFAFAPYSFSRISCFECPRKFKYCYVDKIKPNKPISPALIRGARIHHLLEHFPESLTECSENEKTALLRFFSHNSAKFLNNLGIKSVREFGFGLDFDLNPCEYSSKNCLFHGRIDLMLNIDGTLFLVDYKTGKAKDQAYQNFTQLEYYSLYFFQKYPKINRVKIVFLYFDEDHANILEIPRNSVQKIKNSLLSNIQNIEITNTTHEYPRKISVLCKYCDFEDICQNDKQ